ncbi:MAG: LLM class flavin-dependent oxidoreductase [Candidatus Tectomicrobia bacterium]|nr:LLM class flavin-dependent oxidoreductase [Candidatus Tectomicrobia bacterium]
MMDVKFGASFVPCQPDELARLCVTAEDAGYDRLGLVDSQSIYRELWVSCTVAASHTTRIKVGPRVTNPITRHLSVTASAAATLEELAPGRIFLGLGSGDSALGNIGLRAASLSEMEEAIHAARALMTGSAAAYHGRSCAMPWSRRAVPIYMSAHGPKSLRLAGRVADGVVIGTGLNREAVAYSLEMIQQGAEEGGRRLADLDLWWLSTCNLAASRVAAIAEVRMLLAANAHVLPNQVRNPALVPPRYSEAIATLAREYVISEHLMPGAARTNVQLVQRLGLEDYLAERFGIVGTPDDCLRQIERALNAGANQLWMSIYFPHRQSFMERWGREIIARFQG